MGVNLGLRQRLLLGMAALMLPFTATSLLALWQLDAMSAQLQRVVERDARRVDLAHLLHAALLDIGMQERTLLPMTDAEDLKTQHALLQAAQARYRDVEARLAALPPEPGEDNGVSRQLAAIRAERAQAEPVHARAVELVMNGAGADAGLTLLLQVERADAHWRTSIAEIVGQITRRNQATHQRDRGRARQARLLLAASLAFSAIAGTFIALRLARVVTRPVADATGIAVAIAEGDLTSEVRAQRGDELGRLLKAIGAMQERLRRMVGGVGETAAAVASASQDVADGSTALLERNLHAAAQLRQTAASLRTLTDTVAASAENALRASACTDEVRSHARDGNQAIVRVRASMDGVELATRKIDGIVGIIGGIAAQTNILALNAAVEAARAGEQGRGFAVVASEVRTLAQRAAEAAKQIGELSREASARIAGGNSDVRHAVAMARTLMERADMVAGLVASLSDAAASQNEGLRDIDQALGRLDAVTRQNAGMGEASVATAATLAGQSRELVRMVGMFHTRAAGSARPAALTA
ncbi:methyl-accepting chemotaxis protein [Pseudoduganella namucuonensis]|uniref:Methyl-accepting chemotaxis protein n=1 Tax=Pseudoduganella namucuonensis TaxID=1035707 RepID=A0A1I7LHR0_9BURK|nr:methyl-accepting chemotaxis protein [Pseudoduganella namucuonensis]SFV09221.1 methyl-accepting chemotaxis protein [Pseudoduganella namucuonensis]